MKKFTLFYAMFWGVASLMYLVSCFDGVYSERLYSIVEVVTFPLGAVSSKWGIALETRYGFSILMLFVRFLLEIAFPAIADFGAIYAALLLWRLTQPKPNQEDGVQ